uniref:Apple domain-containing protein n=1 Tax=Caenorhabditis japonica TaxID=281687 RepID=A0A8R1IBN2_CAEJA
MKSHTEKKSIDEKLEDLKTEDKQKYDMLMGEKSEEKDVEEEKQKLKNSLRYGAKVIKFDEEAAFRKQSELRRKPAAATRRPALKPVTISSTSYIQKAKSFLDELNESDDDEQSREEVITTECRSDDVDVWVAFENSEQADESENSEIDANVPSRKECQKVCQQKNCRSFTYFEKTRTCHLSTKSDGVTLQSPVGGDFAASTSTKFCYPQTFTVFEGCSSFVAFRDYSVRIEAVEEFDGLPRGYDGMQLCVELCVLSTRYTCRSATFNPITGKCRLLTEDSLSSPDDFKYDEFQKDLYFENGCTTAGNDDTGSADRNVEIVSVKPKKLKKKVRRVKKLLRRLRA